MNNSRNGWTRLIAAIISIWGLVSNLRTVAAFFTDLHAGTLRWITP